MTIKRITKTLLMTCLVAICFLQCSCSLFLYDNTRFSGGEILNDNLIDEIKSELFASDTKSEQQSVEDSSDLKKEDKTENTEGVFIESDASSDNDQTSETESTNGEVVYWTKSGSVWHSYSDCGHIKNSNNVISGTVEEARSAGKSNLCKSCEKRDDP